jgi:hypothetical protein
MPSPFAANGVISVVAGLCRSAHRAGTGGVQGSTDKAPARCDDRVGTTLEVTMTSLRAPAIVAAFVFLNIQPALAQPLAGYRGYVLGGSLASVLKLSGARQADTKTHHVRPATIQELEWFTPYTGVDRAPADPVHDVVFSFYNDQLYQVVVTYDRGRMEGLTNDDVIASVGSVYGVPLLRHAPAVPKDATTYDRPETLAIARWEDAASLLTLTRSTYSPQFQLVLTSKTLDALARAAIVEARRLDTLEAPQREMDQRKQEVVDAHVASQKARTVNKPAFRP